MFGENSAGHRNELIYSLLSLKKVAGEWSIKNISILIYTDSTFIIPECINNLNLKFNVLEKEEINNWIRRGNGHALILKAVVMNDFLKKYKACGILVDTDTFFIKDPEQLFGKAAEGNLFMHLQEYPISYRPGIYSFFKKKAFKHLDGSEHVILPDFYMWNSGIVGLTPMYLSVTDEIINLIEQVAAENDWPADQEKFIEQTCFSYYLQEQHSKLLPAEEYVVHYWFFKQARYLLGYHLGFFYGSDEVRFNQLIVKHQLQATRFSKLPYNTLPIVIASLMKEFRAFQGYHFESLPINTYIGKVIRGINNVTL